MVWLKTQRTQLGMEFCDTPHPQAAPETTRPPAAIGSIACFVINEYTFHSD